MSCEVFTNPNVEDGKVDVRMAELNVVEGIQEISPELHIYSLGEVEVLQQAQVRVGISRTNVGALAGQLPKVPVAGSNILRDSSTGSPGTRRLI